jgi:molybdate transport system ATP-binding protein
VSLFEKSFEGGARIAFDLPLSPDDGRVTVLFGPSGAGKTTILRCLAGLERPTRGQIRFGQEIWFDESLGIDVPPQERRVGFLFQDHALFPHLSVAQNVGFGIAALAPADREARVIELLRFVRLDGLGDRRPGELSGGQRQRVALARALAREPRLLLLDEPLNSLDAPTREELRGELGGMLAALRIPTLFVTHDRVEALTLADRMVVVAGGHVLQVGPADVVVSRPVDADVARIVGVETVATGRVVAASEDGLVSVALGAHGTVVLSAIDPGNLEESCLVCIRAEEVMLERGALGQVSARNRLAGVITTLSAEGPLVRVGLDCGFPLAALVTRASCAELELRVGETVTACIKSPAVHLIPRAGAASAD